MPHGTVDFITSACRSDGGNRLDDRMDRREVGVAGVGRRRADGDEQQPRMLERLAEVGREVQALAVAREQLLEPRLVDRHLAARAGARSWRRRCRRTRPRCRARQSRRRSPDRHSRCRSPRSAARDAHRRGRLAGGRSGQRAPRRRAGQSSAPAAQAEIDSRRKTGCFGAAARSCSSDESGPTPSKNTPTSDFQRFR